MKTYKIPCVWQMVGWMDVEAESLEEAIDYAKNEAGLPDDGYYLENSKRILVTGVSWDFNSIANNPHKLS